MARPPCRARVDGDLGEIRNLLERLEHRTVRCPEPVRKVDVADEAIREGEPEAVAVEMFDGSDLVEGAQGIGWSPWYVTITIP